MTSDEALLYWFLISLIVVGLAMLAAALLLF